MTTSTTAAETLHLVAGSAETHTGTGDGPPKDRPRLFYSPILLSAAEVTTAARPVGIVVPVNGGQPAAQVKVEFVFD